MPKNNEWTYRPKYTKARIAKELADKEQELTSTLTELLRVQTIDGAKMKDIVFECFVKMLDDLRFAREQIADCMGDNWDPDEFFFATHLNINSFQWFLQMIGEYIFGFNEGVKKGESEALEHYLKDRKEDVA